MRLRFGGSVVRTNWRAVPVIGAILFVILFFILHYDSGASGKTEDPPRRARGSESKPYDRTKGRLEKNVNKQYPNVEKAAERHAAANGANVESADSAVQRENFGYKAAMDPDHVLRFKKMDDKVQKRAPMAMDAAKEHYEEILKEQQRIIKAQIRPPDKRYNINITLSDIISMDRDIEDTRPKICRSFKYDRSRFSRASVVIPFFNEALTMLLRTVHSILNRTPDDLLDHVILVDDRSTNQYLQESFERYITSLPKTKLIRNRKREGLIRSRMIGAEASVSDVVVFLDAHTEANEGWLEPLLQELLDHPASITQPFVDGIDAWSIAYSAPPTIYKGAFSWDLRYTWLRVPDHLSNQVFETGVPYFSPTLVGCAIAVNKQYFYDIGAFDQGLKVWGGENIELAFRTWMCNGRVVTVPCSRVGHVFKNFPYKFDGDRDKIVQKNLMRVADTWMDDYRKYFYASTRIYDFKRVEFTEEERKSLQPRIELRKRLKCNSFQWYMDNIIPEVEAPPMDSLFYGEIMNHKTRACFTVADDGYVVLSYYCYEHKIIPRNYFRITRDGLLRHKHMCVTFDPPTPALFLRECPTHDLDHFTTWELKQVGHTWGLLKAKRRNERGIMEHWCVIQVTNILNVHHREQMPQIGGCDDQNQFQIWIFTYQFDFSLTL